MGDVISEAKLLDPRNRAKVEQTLSLIFRGKGWVAGQDPALRPFLNALVLKGAISAEEINRRIQVQKQEEAKKATFNKVLVEQMKQQGRERLTAIEGATAGEQLRATLKLQQITGRPTIIQKNALSQRIIIEKRRPSSQQIVFQEVGLKDFGERAGAFESLSRGSQRETERLLQRGDLSPKEKVQLVALQFALPSVQFITGLKQLPSFIKGLVKNPKNIVKVPKQILLGFKETGLEIVALAKVAPALAVARVGGEIILLVAIGESFKVVGKVGKGVSRTVGSGLKRVRGGIIVGKGVGTKGLIKLKLVSRKTMRAIEQKSKLAKTITKKAGEIKRVVKKKVKITKATQKLEIRKFKGRVEFANQLKRARIARNTARVKGRTINIGTRDYTEGIAFIEELADRIAINKARQFLKAFKASGGKLGLGQADDFIKATRTYVNKSLNNFPKFKALKSYAKLREPFQIKLLRAKKISPATKLIKSINLKIKNLTITKKMKSIFKKIKRIKKLPSKIKKGLAKKKLQRIGRQEFRKSFKYRIEKARPLRKVTLEQLQKSSTTSQMNKFIDQFFNEMGKRQKINISSVKFRQMKNLLKKRMSRAIKTGNKAERIRFEIEVKKLINNMNKPSSSPTVRIIEKVGKKKTIRTIKDFAPEVKRGQYVEVRSGQQVLLQKVKQVQKLKPAQKLVQRQAQTFVIQSVQKQSLNLFPLVKFLSEVLVDFFLRSLIKQRSLQKAGQGQMAKQQTKTIQDAKQDLKTLQGIAPALKTATAQRIRQALKQDTATKQRLIPIQKLIPEQLEKKKTIKRAVKKPLAKKKIKKIKVTGYVSKTKTKLNKLPLTKKRALDILAYSLDRSPSIKGKTIKSIRRVKEEILRRQLKSVPKGYFQRHRRKFVLRKLKKGRETFEMIEKKKFRKDSPRERIKRRNKK